MFAWMDCSKSHGGTPSAGTESQCLTTLACLGRTRRCSFEIRRNPYGPVWGAGLASCRVSIFSGECGACSAQGPDSDCGRPSCDTEDGAADFGGASAAGSDWRGGGWAKGYRAGGEVEAGRGGTERQHAGIEWDRGGARNSGEVAGIGDCDFVVARGYT